ncbi:SHD1 domain-containing protein [Pontiellaceae bacterium B12227]|nr:SHD1 domain-containing protein [Pontiellaceae bacterium B12227]
MQKKVLCLMGLLGLSMSDHALAESRIWNFSGKTVEGEYINIIGDKLVLKSSKGKTVKVPLVNLSPEDREYLTLLNAPKFVIGFLKKANQRFVETGPFIENVDASFTDYEFGVRIRQDDRGDYNYELKVEYWAIGNEVKAYGDKYILLDRGESVFTPMVGNDRSHVFTGNAVELMQHVTEGEKRGRDYYGYVITVTDIRGEIIIHLESNEWLWEKLEQIKELPVGAFFDKSGLRCHPTRPKPTRY